jgi:hypothetical protein
MVSTSGTTTFDLSFDEILDEAIARAGGELTTGKEAYDARRSLNLLLLDLVNRGVPLAAMEELEVTTTAGTAEYTLPTNVMAVMYAICNRDSTDFQMSRYSLYDYKAIPRKSQEGRPTTYTSFRDRDTVTLKLWPTPENSTDTIKYWALAKLEDVTRQSHGVDLPTRYLPAIVAGLAYFIAIKRVPEKTEVIMRLKADYEETLQRALDEDRERSSLMVVPSMSRVLK